MTPRLAPFFDLIALDAVTSTNDEAVGLAVAGAGTGTLVWARTQSKGRGRRGRSWSSPEGNLYLSLILRPGREARRAAGLAFLAAIAIGEGIAPLIPASVAIRYKWPNDVLLNGRKVAGVLLESSLGPKGGLDWLVIGVGVNVESFPEGTGYPATSLVAEGAEGLGPACVLEGFCQAFLSAYERWRDEGFAGVRARWLARAAGIGERIEVRLDDETLSGIFAGLDGAGALILRRAGEEDRRISAGDVFLPAAADR